LGVMCAIQCHGPFLMSGFASPGSKDMVSPVCMHTHTFGVDCGSRGLGARITSITKPNQCLKAFGTCHPLACCMSYNFIYIYYTSLCCMSYTGIVSHTTFTTFTPLVLLVSVLSCICLCATPAAPPALQPCRNININAFRTAHREFKFCQMDLRRVLGLLDDLICPACSEGYGAVHIDANMKLFTWARKREEWRTPHYQLFARDEEVLKRLKALDLATGQRMVSAKPSWLPGANAHCWCQALPGITICHHCHPWLTVQGAG